MALTIVLCMVASSSLVGGPIRTVDATQTVRIAGGTLSIEAITTFNPDHTWEPEGYPAPKPDDIGPFHRQDGTTSKTPTGTWLTLRCKQSPTYIPLRWRIPGTSFFKRVNTRIPWGGSSSFWSNGINHESDEIAPTSKVPQDIEIGIPSRPWVIVSAVQRAGDHFALVKGQDLGLKTVSDQPLAEYRGFRPAMKGPIAKISGLIAPDDEDTAYQVSVLDRNNKPLNGMVTWGHGFAYAQGNPKDVYRIEVKQMKYVWIRFKNIPTKMKEWPVRTGIDR